MEGEEKSCVICVKVAIYRKRRNINTNLMQSLTLVSCCQYLRHGNEFNKILSVVRKGYHAMTAINLVCLY